MVVRPSESFERASRWSRETNVVIDSLGSLAQRDSALGSLTTYRVGGPAAALINIDSVADLEEVRGHLAGSSVPILVIGRGSNLLVADAGFDGIVLRLTGAFEEIEIDEDQRDDGRVRVRAGGAAKLPMVARQSARRGLTGLEWAVGVPGTVGGAVRMNAGGHGADMADSLLRVSVFDLVDGGPADWSLQQLDLSYRRSAVEASHVVLFAEFGVRRGPVDQAEALLAEIVAWRRANQPGGQNAGSVFANPEGDSAGRLIEAAGLKGFRIGTAEVSTKHANFIQADPEGSADDVYALIGHVRAEVAQTFGISLRPENELIGFGDVKEGRA